MEKEVVKMESLMGEAAASLISAATNNHHSNLTNKATFSPSSTTTTTTPPPPPSSLGFMESVLGLQEIMINNNMNPSLLDMIINGYGGDGGSSQVLAQSLDPPLPDPSPLPASNSNVNPESSDQVANNQPTTPNSSSVSSASNEASNEDHHHHNHHQQSKGPEEEDEEEQQKDTTKDLTKAKKTNQKRQREPRFAFMTRSEVDHLEDGYRWRKYGQKAVKNSPFPRSYYRCTSASCNVKKRVERSCTDASIVVTTYEGQHTHPCTVLPRGVMPGPLSAFGFGPGTTTTSPYALHPMQMASSPNHNTQTLFSPHHQLQTMSHVNGLGPHHLACFGNVSSAPANALLLAQDKGFCAAPVNVSLLRDNGLLQDMIVPSTMKTQLQ